MTNQILAFLFCFIRELTLLPPLPGSNLSYFYWYEKVVLSEAFSLFLLRKHFITEFFFKKKSGDVNGVKVWVGGV